VKPTCKECSTQQRMRPAPLCLFLPLDDALHSHVEGVLTPRPWLASTPSRAVADLRHASGLGVSGTDKPPGCNALPGFCYLHGFLRLSGGYALALLLGPVARGHHEPAQRFQSAPSITGQYPRTDDLSLGDGSNNPQRPLVAKRGWESPGPTSPPVTVECGEALCSLCKSLLHV